MKVVCRVLTGFIVTLFSCSTVLADGSKDLSAEGKQPDVSAKQPKAKIVEIFDDVEYHVQSSPSGVHEVNIQLEMRSPGEEIVGRLQWFNATEAPIEIKRVRSSCGCLKAESRLVKIGVGEKSLVKFSMPVPSGVPSVAHTVTLDCDGPLDQIRITLSVPIRDGVGFRHDEQRFQVDIEKKIVELQVPFFFSQNLTLEDLTATATGDLSMIKWRKEVVEGAGYCLLGQIDSDDVPPIGIDETLSLKSKAGYIAKIAIRIFSPDPIRLSPEMLTFFRETADEDYVAILIISLSSNSKDEIKYLDISAKLNDDQVCTVDRKLLGSRAVRVQLKVRESSNKLLGEELFANVVVNGTTFKLPVQFQ